MEGLSLSLEQNVARFENAVLVDDFTIAAAPEVFQCNLFELNIHSD